MSLSKKDELCKIFVGNVPYQCTRAEFEKCFEKFKGFVKAEIVSRPMTDISRGFGFVTFDTRENANILLEKKDLCLHDRTLRFTEYNLKSDKETTDRKFKSSKYNHIFIKNIPKDAKVEDLRKFFMDFGKIGTCYINTNTITGDSRNTGVVEIIDDNIYQKLLDMKTIPFMKNNLILVKWKQPQAFNHNINPAVIYRTAFKYGVAVGIEEGFKMASNKKI